MNNYDLLAILLANYGESITKIMDFDSFSKEFLARIDCVTKQGLLLVDFIDIDTGEVVKHFELEV